MSDTPYWKAGMPVTALMGIEVGDLCDACGICRDRHIPPNFCPQGGFASGYRRAIGPPIVDQITHDGVATILHQPAPPGQGYRG